MIDVSVPRSPGWWLNRLIGRLAAKRDRLNVLERYLLGDADLPMGSDSAANHRWRDFQRKSGINLGGLVVDAVASRLEPVGFRTGVSGDVATDDLAWQVWQANRLDAAAKEFHRSVLGLSEAYTIVGDIDPDHGFPLISMEDPRQVIVEEDPARRWNTLAALKLYDDDIAGESVAVLYLPGVVYRAVGALRRIETGLGWSAESLSWSTATLLPIRRVPVVRYRNRPSLHGVTLGEFEDAIPHIDRVNHMVFQRLVVATVQAFKQRAVKGLPARDPVTGELIDYTGMFQSGPDALWQLPPGAEVWESSQVDMAGILNGESADLRSLATATSTPLYMLSSDQVTADDRSASLQREAHTFKCRDRQVTLGESHEITMSLAFEWMGKPDRARLNDLEMLWAPVSNMSLLERADAAAKAAAAGVPWAFVMSDVMNYSPAQIRRMEGTEQVKALLAGEVPAQVA